MKTIKLSISAVILLTALFTRAQDVITLKNGDEIKAKVLEVGLGEIRYKKADNPNGPLYSASKASIFMIKYENGTKDVFVAPSMGPHDMRGDMHGGYRGDSKGEYEMLMHKYRRSLAGGIVMTAVGVPMIPIGLGLALGGISMQNSYDMYGNPYHSDRGPMIATGVLFLAGGIAMTVVGPIKISKAKRYKAKAREIGPTMSFAPILSPGIGGQAMKTGAGVNINF